MLLKIRGDVLADEKFVFDHEDDHRIGTASGRIGTAGGK